MAAPCRQIMCAKFLAMTRSKWMPSQVRALSVCSSRFSRQTDIRKLFINDEVQSILKRVTGFDMHRINASKLMDLQESQVKLLTDDQLREVQELARIEAESKLMMPPVMDPREEVDELLADTPEIAEAIHDKMVFTDITFGVPDRERITIVRETDGKLRSATWTERERVQQIYFPLEGRKLRIPTMFMDENLQLVLDEQRYIYALERACLQFEPDDPIFIRVTNTVYDHILDHKHFDSLRSSRHFGPMAFHHARHKKIDHLLIYFLNQNELDCAADTVRLVHMMHPDMKSALSAAERSVSEHSELVELYCEMDAQEKGPISLLLQSQLENQAEA